MVAITTGKGTPIEGSGEREAGAVVGTIKITVGGNLESHRDECFYRFCKFDRSFDGLLFHEQAQQASTL